MCVDPVTAGMAVVGLGMSVMSGMQQKAAADAQAQQYANAAVNARTETAIQEQDIQRKASRTRGALRAAMAGSGASSDSESFIDLISDTDAGVARDVYNVKFSGKNRSDSLEASAANARWAGSNALWGSIIGGGLRAGSILAGPLFGSGPTGKIGNAFGSTGGGLSLSLTRVGEAT